MHNGMPPSNGEPRRRDPLTQLRRLARESTKWPLREKREPLSPQDIEQAATYLLERFRAQLPSLEELCFRARVRGTTQEEREVKTTEFLSATSQGTFFFLLRREGIDAEDYLWKLIAILEGELRLFFSHPTLSPEEEWRILQRAATDVATELAHFPNEESGRLWIHTNLIANAFAMFLLARVEGWALRKNAADIPQFLVSQQDHTLPNQILSSSLHFARESLQQWESERDAEDFGELLSPLPENDALLSWYHMQASSGLVQRLLPERSSETISPEILLTAAFLLAQKMENPLQPARETPTEDDEEEVKAQRIARLLLSFLALYDASFLPRS